MTTTYQTNLLSTEYNGWSSYETFNVALWIQNDEYLYNTAKDCVKYCTESETPYEKFIRCMMNIDRDTTGDNVRWDDDAVNISEINKVLEDL